jgi:hypothetical protein
MPARIAQLRPGELRERDPVMAAVLAFVTCGIYALIWKFQTTSELRRATGDDTLSPTTDLLVTLASCGLWGIYTDYRNAQLVADLFQGCGVARESQAWAVVVLDFLGLGVVSTFLLQRELNAASKVRSLPA